MVDKNSGVPKQGTSTESTQTDAYFTGLDWALCIILQSIFLHPLYAGTRKKKTEGREKKKEKKNKKTSDEFWF